MKKKVLCLLMAALMTFGAADTAMAENFKGSSGWQCTYDGKKMTTNFKSKDMKKDVFSKLEPGDSIDLVVTVKNSSNGKANIYLENEVIRTLEQSQAIAKNGGYGYELVYKAPDGSKKTIYSSSNVGGNKNKNGTSLQGLKEATDATDEFLLLDTFAKGESGKVYLKVSLDGETQGNYYQNTLGDLKLRFAAESLKSDSKIVKKKRVIRRTPKTGDTTLLMLWSLLGLLSGLVLLYFGIASIRRRDRKEGRV